ncbi:hypothetical protein LUZ60_016841 [Juncus effusus]|nr:hypothetical protein LUZ60_016841 [Juncus effusus]
MGGADNFQLISVDPEELTFEFELERPSSCNLKLVNKTEHHVAFKVKTTSPKKYFVRPNSNIVQPWDSCTITVTLQAQREYPPDMICKDKFLIQSTKITPRADLDEIPPDTFNKDGDKIIEEMKLRVIYKNPNSRGNSGMATPAARSSEDFPISANEEMLTIQRLREDRDKTIQHNQQLQRDLEMMRRRKNKGSGGFSFRFAIFVGLLGLFVGLILNLSLTSPASNE